MNLMIHHWPFLTWAWRWSWSPARVLGVALSVALLAGCAVAPSGSPAPVLLSAADQAREVTDLLDFYRRLAEGPSDAQREATRQAEADFERDPGEIERLRLALVLSLPRAAARDDARAAQLLEPLVPAPDSAASPRHDLAVALRLFLGERLRAREEQRKAEESVQKLQAQLAERQRQLRAEQRKAEELERKVDALRKIDRDALRRPGAPR